MAPKISEDEIDDLIYFSRAGEASDLAELLSAISSREGASRAEVLLLAKDEGKSTCLHMATGNGHLEIVKSLLEHFSSRSKEEKQTFLDAPNEYGNAGLHWAALGGHLEVVKVLMAHGATPALANDKNYVPLDLASFNNHVAVVDYFLEQSKSLEGENGDSGLGDAVDGMELGDSGDADEKEKSKDGEAGKGASNGGEGSSRGS